MQGASILSPGRRRGQLIPMVGLILILFAFIAFSYMFRSQTATSITGISVYGMQAHQLALAFADEAKVVLMESFDELDGNAPWKAELMGLLLDQADGPAVTLDRPDFGGELPRSQAMLAQVGNARLELCSLRLHGFHRLHYAASDLYDAAESFYKSTVLDPDDTTRMPVDDWIGYATIQVRVSIRGIERQVQVTHDLKVVDVQPPAREFAFMAWAPVTQEMADAGTAHASLNQGGSMAIWPNDVGRVMIRGPYPVVVEGNPKGEGGEKRGGDMRTNFSYPDGKSDWYGWSVVPGPRALKWNQLAMPWGSNIRPDSDGAFVKARVRWPTKDFVSIDTNTSVVDCPSQSFYCGATEVGNQAFSPWGRPGTGANSGNDLSMFRGFRVDFNNGGQITGAYEDAANFGGGSSGDGITFEGGGVYSIVNQANFKNNFGVYACFSFTLPCPGPCCFGANVYSGFSALQGGPCMIGLPCIGVMLGDMNHSPPLDPSTYSGGSSGRYLKTLWALRYWEEESVPIWTSLIGAAISFTMAAYTDGNLFGGDAPAAAAPDGFIGPMQPTWGTLWENTTSTFSSEVFMKTAGKALMASITSNLAGTLKPGTTGATYPTAAELADSVPEGLFPPKFREYMRGATRIHRTLEEALALDGNSLNLDGIVLVERMPQDSPATFKYRGKGVLVSLTDGTVNMNPFLGDITPEDAGDDYLTFAHFVKREPLPDGGDCQVRLQSTQLELSLYASEGVISDDNAAIFGNYVVAWPNKFRIAQGTEFDIFYNKDRLAPSRFGGPAEDEWVNGAWKRVTVSPKVSGYYDRFR